MSSLILSSLLDPKRMLDRTRRCERQRHLLKTCWVPHGLLGCNGEKLAQDWCFLFSSSVASMDFQLTLNIRLFILNWLFMVNSRYLLVKNHNISFHPFFLIFFSYWAFSCVLSIPCTFPSLYLVLGHSFFLVYPPSLTPVCRPAILQCYFQRFF